MSMWSEWQDLVKASPDAPEDNDPSLFWIQYILSDVAFRNDDESNIRIIERGFILAALRHRSVGGKTDAVYYNANEALYDLLEDMKRTNLIWRGELKSGISVSARMVLEHCPPRWVISTSPGGTRTDPMLVRDAYNKLSEIIHTGGGLR